MVREYIIVCVRESGGGGGGGVERRRRRIELQADLAGAKASRSRSFQ